VRIWRFRWPDLVSHLRASTNACLTQDERVRFLADPPEQARKARDACERRFGRRTVPKR
jgi:hypothetical protein